MAATRKLLHHLFPSLCLISFFLSLTPPTLNAALHLPKYHLSLSLTLVHYCTVATSRGDLFCWIHQTKHWMKDSGRLCFSLHNELEKACELFPGPLRLCVIGWIWRLIYFAGCLCVALSICVHEFMHVCLLLHMKRLLSSLATTRISWKSLQSCSSIAAVNQPLTQCRCEDQGMLNISELLYIEVVTHLEWQE